MNLQSRNALYLLLMIVSSLFFSGCAFFIKGIEPVPIQVLSSPTGASCEVFDKNTGNKISAVTTPAVMHLSKRQGYFVAPSYRVKCMLQNYEPQEAFIEGTVTGWYMGNLAFGGVIGMLIVDPASGAMWTLEPDTLFFDYEDPHKSILGESYAVSDRGFRTRESQMPVKRITE